MPFGRCDFAQPEWYCWKLEGHDGPHESPPLYPQPSGLGSTETTAEDGPDVTTT